MGSKLNSPKVIITHHSGGTDANPLADTSNHTVNHINEWHKKQWPDFVSLLGYHVGYHYFIDKNGGVTQTRMHSEEGAHTIGMNKSSIGVCFAGNFDVTRPTARQMIAWNKLYKKLRKEYPGIPTRPHRAYATKSCHGKLLGDNYFALSDQSSALLDKAEALVYKLTSIVTRQRQ